jgi:hypothetical protein
MTQEQRPSRRAPLEHIQNQPWSFAALALAAGFGIGLFFRMGSMRKAFRVYGLLRRFV